MIVKTFGLSQLIYFLQSCEIREKELISVERTIFKFLWNKKWAGKCPDRIKRQVLKNSYQNGGMKAPDVAALDCALKIKQFLNATKSKNKIKIVQRLFTSVAAPICDTQLIYEANKCTNKFITKAMESLNKLNKISFDKYKVNLVDVKNENKDVSCLKPYLEHFVSLDLKAYFARNLESRAAINMFYNRNIKNMEKIISEINFPVVAGGFLNRETIKRGIPKEILEGLNICRVRNINIINNDELKLPNYKDSKLVM